MKAAPKIVHLQTSGSFALDSDILNNELGLNGWVNDSESAEGSMDSQYGRRVESDRSWTIYHVFTGAPARIDGRTMTGLSHGDATDRMMALNQSNVVRRQERSRRSPTLTPVSGARRS